MEAEVASRGEHLQHAVDRGQTVLVAMASFVVSSVQLKAEEANVTIQDYDRKNKKNQVE